MDKKEKLKDLISKKELILAPGVYDALSARVAQYSGFPVLYMTGYGVAAVCGYPDYGLLTMSEMLESVRRISDATEIPLVADADTGYGNAVNVYRTVKEYEKAGAAAIQLEDQSWPKRCGFMQNKQVIAADEMVDKIKAAVDARTDEKTVLIIRTDSFTTDGSDEAFRRAEMYAEAGADMLFIEAPNAEHIKDIPSRFSKPCVLNMAFHLYDISISEIRGMGYAMVLFPGLLIIGGIAGYMKSCRKLMEEGKYMNPIDLPFTFEQFNSFLGIDAFRKLEDKYAKNK
jgi:2,3-dimethylmalate lyase